MENSNLAATDQQKPNLPPGFRFHPTDEELVVHYLKKKATSLPLPVAIIAEVDLYKYDPWELPAKATYGEKEWYFFSPRDRKYPNGARPNRAATSGYWKATGTDKPVIASSEGNQKVGVKKALVFYGGKPPKGIKTNWIMHEYRLADSKTAASSHNKPPFNLGNKKNSLRLDDWVLCRIYKKTNSNKPVPDHEIEDCLHYMVRSIPPQPIAAATARFNALFENNFNLPSDLPLKRALQPSPPWYGEEYHLPDDTPSSKRLQLINGSGNDDNSSIATLLCQLPQLQHQTMLDGIVGDGIFQTTSYQRITSETNWYF